VLVRTSGAFLAAVVLAIAACGEPIPTGSGSPGEAVGDGVALSCWDVDDPECQRAFAEAVQLLPRDGPPIVAASVVAFGCDNPPCAKGLQRGGSVSVEYANGGGLNGWSISAGADGSLTLGEHTTGLARRFLPASARLAQPSIDFSLGHCGLSSPIDVDGSFWDPVGQVDSDAAFAVNSDTGTFTLVGPDDAEFRSSTGFAVRLRRHEGARNLFGCF